MGLFEIFAIAVGPAMDAFAVSVCKGLAMRRMELQKALLTGLWFGAFQTLMPLAGFFLGVQFRESIETVDHWIAFGLLAVIGINMIREALGEEEKADDSFDCKTMLLLAIATSIDALAVGVTFAFLEVDILLAATVIGVVAFVLSAAGVKIGNVFGARYKKRAELAGGIILILMGIKILLEHLGWLAKISL